MDDDGFLTIGRFSVLTGLSITTLRHYDDVQLFVPVEVDPVSGYRRYSLDQVSSARFVRALRSVDLPIESIRELLSGEDELVRSVLLAHRDELSETIAVLDDLIENGVRMKTTQSCRVAEVNVGVDDLRAACDFYRAVFDIDFVEERHGDGPVHAMATFGSWPSDEFFLLNLTASDDAHRVGRADFGLLVDDLDAFHQRAIAAGAFELAAPHAASGMPRCSGFCDPSGNVVNLYQNA